MLLFVFLLHIMATRLLIIIPCFNEEDSIVSLLNELNQMVVPNTFTITVAVINDCSNDNTSMIAEKFSVVVINLPVNLGIGGAMQTGYKYAWENNFDLAVQMDGDGQHPPAELNKLLQCWQNTQASVVIGSRFLVKQGFQSSLLRRWGINYFHWLNKFFTGIHIYDCTSGFRLFDRKAIELAVQYYPDEYPEPESIVFFAKSGLSIHETPVIMKERQGGKSSIRHFYQLYYIIKVSIAMFFSFIRK